MYLVRARQAVLELCPQPSSQFVQRHSSFPLAPVELRPHVGVALAELRLEGFSAFGPLGRRLRTPESPDGSPTPTVVLIEVVRSRVDANPRLKHLST